MRRVITVRDGGDEWISLRRRMLHAGCFPALILGPGILILIVSLIAVSRLTMSAGASRARSAIAFGVILLLVLNAAASEGLRIGAALMGSRVGVSGNSGIVGRLRVIQRRLLPIEISLVVLRVLTYFPFGLAAGILLVAYSRGVTPAPAEWGEFLARSIRGILTSISPWDAGFLGFMGGTAAHSLIGPFLSVPYSAALGALVGTRIRENDKAVGLTLTMRIGASLAGTLLALWGWALLLLIALTIEDLGSYSVASPTFQVNVVDPLRTILTPLAGVMAAIGSIVIYTLSQVLLARVFTLVAARQHARQRETPKRKERFVDFLESIVPHENGEQPGNQTVD